MILPIVKYGHPALRQRGAPIEKLTPELARLIADMLETMQSARGVGLAAQQVGRALQLTVIDVRGVTDRPSTMSIGGNEVEVVEQMPLVLINPEVKPVGEPVAGPEGCLSFPEIYGEITRPESSHVTGLNQNWETVRFQCGGLLARAIQHEADHLRGILFIDRMKTETLHELKKELDELQAATRLALKK